MNGRRRFRKWLLAVLWVAVVPWLVVGVKYWEWERTLHVDETGHGFSVPLGTSTYARALEALYFPTRSVMQSVVRPLRVGGVAVEFLVDLCSVALQHAVLLLLWNAWQASRWRRSANTNAGRDET